MSAFVATVELEDGTIYHFTAARRPRAWKSWAMRQIPYDADRSGVKFAQKSA